MLSRAATVSATVVPLEPGYVHVALSADTRTVRNEYVGAGAALAGAGLAGTVALVALGALLPLALLPVPVAFGVGYSVLRRFAPAVARIQLGLERALDFLEQGGATPHQLPDRAVGILDLLADEVRKALKD
jgi:hypothetical protein